MLQLFPLNISQNYLSVRFMIMCSSVTAHKVHVRSENPPNIAFGKLHYCLFLVAVTNVKSRTLRHNDTNPYFQNTSDLHNCSEKFIQKHCNGQHAWY